MSNRRYALLTVPCLLLLLFLLLLPLLTTLQLPSSSSSSSYLYSSSSYQSAAGWDGLGLGVRFFHDHDHHEEQNDGNDENDGDSDENDDDSDDDDNNRDTLTDPAGVFYPRRHFNTSPDPPERDVSVPMSSTSSPPPSSSTSPSQSSSSSSSPSLTSSSSSSSWSLSLAPSAAPTTDITNGGGEETLEPTFEPTGRNATTNNNTTTAECGDYDFVVRFLLELTGTPGGITDEERALLERSIVEVYASSSSPSSSSCASGVGTSSSSSAAAAAGGGFRNITAIRYADDSIVLNANHNDDGDDGNGLVFRNFTIQYEVDVSCVGCFLLDDDDDDVQPRRLFRDSALNGDDDTSVPSAEDFRSSLDDTIRSMIPNDTIANVRSITGVIEQEMYNNNDDDGKCSTENHPPPPNNRTDRNNNDNNPDFSVGILVHFHVDTPDLFVNRSDFSTRYFVPLFEEAYKLVNGLSSHLCDPEFKILTSITADDEFVPTFGEDANIKEEGRRRKIRQLQQTKTKQREKIRQQPYHPRWDRRHRQRQRHRREQPKRSRRRQPQLRRRHLQEEEENVTTTTIIDDRPLFTYPILFNVSAACRGGCGNNGTAIRLFADPSNDDDPPTITINDVSRPAPKSIRHGTLKTLTSSSWSSFFLAQHHGTSEVVAAAAAGGQRQTGQPFVWTTTTTPTADAESQKVLHGNSRSGRRRLEEEDGDGNGNGCFYCRPNAARRGPTESEFRTMYNALLRGISSSEDNIEDGAVIRAGSVFELGTVECSHNVTTFEENVTIDFRGVHDDGDANATAMILSAAEQDRLEIAFMADYNLLSYTGCDPYHRVISAMAFRDGGDNKNRVSATVSWSCRGCDADVPLFFTPPPTTTQDRDRNRRVRLRELRKRSVRSTGTMIESRHHGCQAATAEEMVSSPRRGLQTSPFDCSCPLRSISNRTKPSLPLFVASYGDTVGGMFKAGRLVSVQGVFNISLSDDEKGGDGITAPPSIVVVPSSSPSGGVLEEGSGSGSAPPSASPSSVMMMSSSSSPSGGRESALPSSRSAAPSTIPSAAFGSAVPSAYPSAMPSDTAAFGGGGSAVPSALPSAMPSTSSFGGGGSAVPSQFPSGFPSAAAFGGSSTIPPTGPSITAIPSTVPSAVPSPGGTSAVPSVIPSVVPTFQPSFFGNTLPSTMTPSALSTASSSGGGGGSTLPSSIPSISPSFAPSNFENGPPLSVPGNAASAFPSVLPSSIPSNLPTTAGDQIASVLPSASDRPSSLSSVPSPTEDISPSFVPSASLLGLLLSVSSDGGEALSDVGSPQFAAFEWLDGNTNLGLFSDARKVQRYAVAVVLQSITTQGLIVSDFFPPPPTPDGDECGGGAGTFFTSCDADDNIVILNVDGFFFSGNLPPEASLLGSLETVAITSNDFTGTLPPDWGSLDQLRNLDLSNNRLSGTIPAQFAGMTSLEILRLNNNELTGTIPSELGSLQQLMLADFRSTRFTGAMPAEICDLPNLVSLCADLDEIECPCCDDCGDGPVSVTGAPTATGAPTPQVAAAATTATPSTSGIPSARSGGGGIEPSRSPLEGAPLAPIAENPSTGILVVPPSTMPSTFPTAVPSASSTTTERTSSAPSPGEEGARSGEWVPVQTFTSTDDSFGASLAMSGDGLTVAIGAPDADGGRGSVRVYRFNIPTVMYEPIGSAIQGVAGGDHAGTALALHRSGDRIAVRYLTKVAVYELGGDADEWEQLGQDMELGGDGDTLAMSRNGAAVIATFTRAEGGNMGAGRLFQFDPSTARWVQRGADIPNLHHSLAINPEGDIIAGSESSEAGDRRFATVVRLDPTTAEGFETLATLFGTTATTTASPDDTNRMELYGYDVDISEDGSTLSVATVYAEPDAGGVVEFYDLKNGAAVSREDHPDADVQPTPDRGGGTDAGGKRLVVSLSETGETFAVGGAGVVTFYELREGATTGSGSAWKRVGTPITTTTTSDQGDGFGTAIVLSSSGANSLVGAPGAKTVNYYVLAAGDL